MAQAVSLSVSRFGILPPQIHFVWSDEGNLCVATFKHVLSIMWPNAVFFLYWSHKWHGVGTVLQECSILLICCTYYSCLLPLFVWSEMVPAGGR